MTAAAESLALGAVLGFSLVIPPGPMNAWIAAASTRSFRSGFVTGLGAMSADALLAAVVYLLARAVDLGAYVRGFYLVGAVVMGYLGVRLVRAPPATGPEPSDRRRYVHALGIGLSNPFQIVWWLTAGVAFAYLGGIVLFAGLFGAIVAWILAFPAAIRAGARRHPAFEPVVRIVSGAILVGFAGYFVFLAVVG